MLKYSIRFLAVCFVFFGVMLGMWVISSLSSDAVAMLLGMFFMLLASFPMFLLMAQGSKPQTPVGMNRNEWRALQHQAQQRNQRLEMHSNTALLIDNQTNQVIASKQF